MRSSVTLCRPEGRDLYSTLSLSSTVVEVSRVSGLESSRHTPRDRLLPCYSVTRIP